MTELDVKLRSLRALPTDPRLDALGDGLGLERHALAVDLLAAGGVEVVGDAGSCG